MRVYQLLDRVFPRSYTAKVFTIAFLGTHVPLLVMVVWALSGSSLIEQLPVLIPILIATLLGTGATLLALRAALAPLFKVKEAMVAYREGHRITPLPENYQDEVGALMSQTNHLLQAVNEDLMSAEQAAQTDPLTQLLNRRGFENVTGRQGYGALLSMDIDHFKAVNDTYGHDLGDRVLQKVAGILRDTTRRSDVVARYGGEEFVAFLPHARRGDAVNLAERLRHAVEERTDVNGNPVTISIGVAVSSGAEDFKLLLRRADEATYQAKKEGRNRVVIHDKSS